jgi:Kef-type K+ transport system membrane component KefB
VLVFATAIAIASVPVISRIMLDLDIMQTSFARIVIATAVIDDLLLYLLLAVALSLVSAGGAPHGLIALLPLEVGGHLAAIVHVLSAVAVVAIVLTAGPRYWRLVASQTKGSQRPLVDAVSHLVFLALVAALCLLLDVNLMFGSLAAGMVAGRSLRDRSTALPRALEWASLKLFVPLYFALVGVRLDLIHHFDAAYFALFLAFACAVKAVSIFAGARAAGESNASALNLAAALNARGGPGIVLAAVSYDALIINENFFAILVLTAIVTSMAAGTWLGRVVRQGHPLRDETQFWPEIHQSAQRASIAS